MGKLNKSAIDRLLNKPQTQKIEIADGLNNLYLIVTKIGSCKFKYRVRRDNQASWISIGDYPAMTLDQARIESSKLKTMINNGVNPVIAKQKEKTKKITFAQFVDNYITERVPVVRTTEKSAANFIRVIKNNVLPIIGKYYLTDIDDSVIKHVIEAKTSNNKFGMARLTRSMLKAMFGYAIEQDLIEKNPVRSSTFYNMASNNTRDRALTTTEVGIVLKTLYASEFIKTKYRVAIHLLLILLLRKTELVHAKWEQIDWKQNTFTLNTSKTGAKLVIPLPTQAISLFRIMQSLSTNTDYIFIGTNNMPLHEHTLNKQSNIINNLVFGNNIDKYFVIHDLRRTGATLLGEMGYPSDYIEVALNHAKGGVKEIYQRSKFLDQRKDMLQVWADKLDNLIIESDDGDDRLLPYGKTFII